MIDHTLEELNKYGWIFNQCKFDWVLPSYKISSRDLSPTGRMLTTRFDEYLFKLRDKRNLDNDDGLITYVVVSKKKYVDNGAKYISLFKIIGEEYD